MKKIIFVHGDKGGVGKSLVSSVIIDNYLRDTKKILVVEGDTVIPDVAKRFDVVDSVEGVIAGLGTVKAESAIMSLIDKLEVSDAERIIVNLPASAGETIDPLAGELSEALEEFGYEIVVVFVVGDAAESVALAKESLKDGLLSIAHKKIAVLNSFFGEPAEFLWSRDDEMRNIWYEKGGVECFLPALADRVKQKTTENSFSFLASKDGGLRFADRLFLKKWLESASPITDAIESKSEEGEGDE